MSEENVVNSFKELDEKKNHYNYITLKVNGSSMTVNLKDLLSISDDTLNDHFKSFPSHLQFWLSMKSETLFVYNKLKIEFELWWAEAYEKAFAQLEEMTGRVPNMSSAENYVKIQAKEQYVKYKEMLESYIYLLSRLDGLIESLRSKGNMLIALGSNYRAELNSQNFSLKNGR